MTLAKLQQRCQCFLDKVLTVPVDIDPAQQRLAAAMRYAALNGGKRMRALLVYATGYLLGGDLQVLDYPAAAVELIHAYSLVHDDLPAMDNSPLRRGVPTCHLAFGEAEAILAGDTMQSMAFELLTQMPLLPEYTLHMLRYLAQASGLHGMAGGQAMDLSNHHRTLDLNTLSQLHDLKTGQLILASIQLGALGSMVYEGDTWARLTQLGLILGRAFQIRDDVLDVAASSEILGKPQGLDATNGKVTFVDLLGIEGCQQQLKDLAAQAYQCLDGYQDKTQLLHELIDFTVNRAY